MFLGGALNAGEGARAPNMGLGVHGFCGLRTGGLARGISSSPAALA